MGEQRIAAFNDGRIGGRRSRRPIARPCQRPSTADRHEAHAWLSEVAFARRPSDGGRNVVCGGRASNVEQLKLLELRLALHAGATANGVQDVVEALEDKE